jgi:hypothetical protein
MLLCFCYKVSVLCGPQPGLPEIGKAVYKMAFLLFSNFGMIFSLKHALSRAYAKSTKADLISFGLFFEARDFTNFSKHIGRLFQRGGALFPSKSYT